MVQVFITGLSGALEMLREQKKQMEEAAALIELAYAYENKELRAPEVHKCSHMTRLKFSEAQLREIKEYGTVTLPPAAVIELVENLKERGN